MQRNYIAKVSILILWNKLEMLLRKLKLTVTNQLYKKKFADNIIDELSDGNNDDRCMFTSEFKSLTDIGNSYRIRHHETNKIDIRRDLYYKYFYKRGLVLISIIIENLQ